MKNPIKFVLLLTPVWIVGLLGTPLAYAGPTNVGCDATELINAIDTANANPDPDVIELAANCEYSLNVGLPGISSQITVVGNGATLKPGPEIQLFNLTGTAVLEISNATLRGAKIECVEDYSGGVIHNSGGTLTLISVTFLENSLGNPGCYREGGAIWNGDGGEATITASRFEKNYAAGSGGAISNSGGTLTLEDVSFKGNLASTITPSIGAGSGGSISNSDDGIATIKNSVFEDGDSGGGGGIYNTGNLTVSTSLFRDMGATSGGGISNYGTAQVTRTVFERNRAADGHNGEPGYGGAIKNGGMLTLTESMVRNNSGGVGGAIYNSGTMNIIGTTIAANRSPREEKEGGTGGGIWNNGALSIVNSTLVDNYSELRGGGILNLGSVMLDNTTIAENRADIGGNLWNEQEATVSAANTIFTKGVPQNCVGAVSDRGGNLRHPKKDSSCIGRFGNPKLGPLQDNGGPVWTMALRPGSAAIDTGSEAVCEAAPVNNLDQRGGERPLDGNGNGAATCDIGAYEAEELPAPECSDLPSVPKLVAPPALGEATTRKVLLDWDESRCALSYRIVVRHDSLHGQVVYSDRTPHTQAFAEKLEWGSTFVWRVRAFNDVGKGEWSAWRSFTVVH